MATTFAFQEGLFPYQKEEILFSQLRDWGFDAVEAWGEKLDERLDRVKAASRAAGIPVCGICPGGQGIRGTLLSSDSVVRAQAREDILTLMRCAAELDGAGLNLVPEFGVEKFMALYPDLADCENRRQMFLDELGPLAQDAEKLGVQILLEPLNRYEAFFLLTVDQAVALCRDLGSPAVAILADLFHMNIEDADMADALSRNMAYIPYIHLADSNRRLPGHGHTDFGAVFSTIQKAGFDGVLSMECWITGEPSRMIPQALSHVRALWADSKY